jgi:hypothetical protein
LVGCHVSKPEDVFLNASADESLSRYRAVSLQALIALVLGIGSALALAHPVLWTVPLVAIGASLAALRSTSQPDAPYSGRTLALLGLVAALFFGSCAIAGTVMSRLVMTRHARTIADEWVRLVQEGKLPRAHQWTQSFWFRELPDAPLDDLYREGSEAAQNMQAYFADEPARTLATLGPRSRIEFRRIEGIQGSIEQRLYLFRYRLVPETAADHTLDFIVPVQRARDSESSLLHWQVRHVAPPED